MHEISMSKALKFCDHQKKPHQQSVSVKFGRENAVWAYRNCHQIKISGRASESSSTLFCTTNMNARALQFLARLHIELIPPWEDSTFFLSKWSQENC